MAMILRDPLQAERTPYELLGVGREAEAKGIRNAFKLAVARRQAGPRQLQQAMKRLFDPRDRALTNALLYNSQAAAHLGGDGDHLGLAAREETDRRWSRQLRDSFPDLAALHNLAVLWYWWAVHESDRFGLLTEALNQHGVSIYRKTAKQGLLEDIALAEGRDCKPSAGNGMCSDPDCPWRTDCSYESPSIDELWGQAIAYWALLLTTQTFWLEHLNAEEAAAREARQNFEERLQVHLFDLRRRFEGASATRLANIVGELEGKLATEVMSARLMARSQVPLLGSGTEGVGAGRLLLDAVGQLDAVRRRVSRQQRLHASGELEELQIFLTPYGDIAQLVAAKRWAEALAQIAKLSNAERNQSQVSRIAAEAYLGKGRQEAGLGNTEAALAAWKAALDHASDGDLHEEIENAVVQTCLERAAALDKRDPDRAVAILEEGIGLVKHRNLRARLGALLFHKSVNAYNSVQERIAREGEATPTDVLDLELALSALERADELGFGRAAGQIPAARDVLSEVRKASEGRKWAPFLRIANEAAGNDDWDKAVRYLRRALKEAGRDAPDFIEENLAASLTTRAIRNVNDLLERGVERVGSAQALKIAEQACKDLMEADSIQPGDSRIKSNRKQAEDLRRKLRTATKAAPWQKSLEQANAAAGRDDWDGAVRYLRRALSEAGRRAPASLKKSLAASLTNCAVSNVNRVMERGIQSVGITAAYAAFDQACDDLAEADRLDPRNSHVLQAKKQAEQLRKQLKPLYRRSGGSKSKRSAWMGVVSVVAGLTALVIAFFLGDSEIVGGAKPAAFAGAIIGVGGLIFNSGRGWAVLGLGLSIGAMALLGILPI